MLSSHASLVMNVQVMAITRLLKFSGKRPLPLTQIPLNFLSNFNMVFIPGRQKELCGIHLISGQRTQQVKTNLKWMWEFTTHCLEKVMAKLQAKVAASTKARDLALRASAGRHLNILKQQQVMHQRIV